MLTPRETELIAALANLYRRIDNLYDDENKDHPNVRDETLLVRLATRKLSFEITTEEKEQVEQFLRKQRT